MRKKHFFAGVKAALPVIVGYVPVAFAYAIMAGEAGLSLKENVLMSVMVFAGASQIMATGMLVQGAGFVAIVTATFLLNLRHFIMSTYVMHRLQDTPMGLRVAASFGVTDESFALFSVAPKHTASVWYLYGMILVTYLSWVGGTIVGALTSTIMPEVLSNAMGISLYAMFIGLLVPNIGKEGRVALLVLATAGINVVLMQLMAYSWAMICSTLLGAALGLVIIPDEPVEVTP